MRVFRLFAVSLLLLLAACNLGIPEVTPTVAPSRTPSETPIVRLTSTPTHTPIVSSTPLTSPTATQTALPTKIVEAATLTQTPTPSATPSDTPTATQTPTGTFTRVPTQTPTRTPFPTLTPTEPPTLTPSDTLTPSLTPTGTLPPTLTPSITPTPTASATPTITPTDTPTATFTPSSTWTLTPSVTPSETPTLTPSLTFTPSPTATPSETPTDTPTPTNTPPPTLTPLPTIGASATFTPPPTATPSETPSLTPTDTPTATATPTIPPRPSDTPAPVVLAPTFTPFPPTWTPQPSLSAEEIENIMRQLTPQITFTPAPTNTPLPISPTSPPQPTLNVPPTFIIENVLAPTPENYTPPPALTTTKLDETASTTSPAHVAPTIEVGPVLENAPTNIAPAPPVSPGLLNYTLSLNGGAFGYGLFDLGGRVGNIDAYAQNPANPNQYAVVNGAGQIFFVSDYASRIIERVPLAFLTEFHWGVTLREDNNAAVTQIAWSNNGSLALIVDGDDSKDTDKDGVWYWSPNGGQFHLVGNCTSVASCIPVVNRGVSNFRAVSLRWSPDNENILVELILNDEGGRRAFIVANWRTTNVDTLPEVFRYEYAHWSSDGRRVVVSGHGPDLRVVAGIMNADGSGLQLIDTAQIGVAWAQDAVEVGGNVYFLGSALGIGSPLSLYDWTGRRLTNDIGDRAPERISWSPDNRAALVVVNVGVGRRYYVARVDTGTVEEISGQVANALTVEWVTGGAPNAVPAATQPPAPVVPSPQASIGAPVPSPVSDTFAPGSQVRVRVQLNFRFQPALGDEYVISQFGEGEILTIVSGPVEAEGFTWYEVRTQAGVTGWVASVISDNPTLERVG